MKAFSFIHAADLHIDSPFRGLSAESEQVASALNRATIDAFEGLVETCLERRVDFLLVAGDVYDGEDRGVGAQLRFHRGLCRLAKEGIRSFVVHGNHDPLNGSMEALEWPDEVKIFGSRAEGVNVESGGEEIARVTGISFPRREVKTDLSGRLRPGGAGLFEIALLHCNVGDKPGHAPYAPCQLHDLVAAGFDYWALGHVHTRDILHENPWVVYPGNPQGRAINEPGARGCYAVQVDEAGHAHAEFLPLDRVRWASGVLSIEQIATLDDLESRLFELVDGLLEAARGRGLVCRLSLEGRGPLYSAIHQKDASQELLARLRDHFSEFDPVVWVQALDVRCRPELDLEERARQGDLMAEILTMAREFRDEPGEFADRALASLFGNSAAKKYLELSDQDIVEIVAEAELLCLDELERDE